MEGLLVAVFSGLIVAVIAGDGTRFAGQDSSQQSPEAPNSPSPPSAGSDADDTEVSGPAVATLKDLAVSEVDVRPGTVAGRSVPPSLHIGLRGSQCEGNVATYDAKTAGRYSEVNLIAALDDTSPPDSRVAVKVFGDGLLLDEAVVEYHTTGAAMSAQLSGVEELSMEMTALTRSVGCATDELHLLAMDGVAR